MGRAAYQRLLRASQAFCAESSYLKRAYTLPIRSIRVQRSLAIAVELRRKREQGRQLTIIVIVAYNHLFRLAILAHFAPKIFVEGIKMILELRGIHLVLGVIGRILVEVGEKDGL